MPEIPQRNSLVIQTIDILRQRIARREWHSVLPGERALSESLQISRPTLRLALDVLEAEGRIKTAQGRSRMIVREKEETAAERKVSVGLVSQDPPHLMAPTSIFYLNELRRHLQEAGLQLTVFANRKLANRNPRNALTAFLDESRVSCWVLLAVNETVQRWFAENHLPAIVAGSAYPGLHLPSLDIDYGAVCRHAAGVFLRHGHRRLAILVPNSDIPGDRTSEAAFLKAIEEAGRDRASGAVFRHDGSRDAIVRVLDRAFARREPPTGLLVCRPLHVLTAVTVLLSRGLAMPGAFSLISRDSDTYLNCVYPDIARYSYRRRTFAHRLARLVIQLANSGSLPKREHRLIPQFHAGATVAPPGGENRSGRHQTDRE